MQASQIEQYRKQTPGCQNTIHLNNAGTGLPTQAVLTSMQDYLQVEAEMGGYETAALQAEAINGFYSATAQMLHTASRNIAFTSNATDSFARALSAIPFEKGDLILTTNDDYISNQIAFLSLVKRMGVKIMRSPNLAEGGCDPVAMAQLIRQHRPRLVSVTHVPTNSGLVQPIAAIGRVCKEESIWYLVDACQSAGQMPLDVQEIHCDFLSATMRKFLRGPRGAGFLYVSDRALASDLHPLLPDMRGANWLSKDEYQLVDSAHRYELWEKSYALMMGSKIAIETALAVGLSPIAKRVEHLSHYLREELVKIPSIRVLDRGTHLCGIVTFIPQGREASDFKAKIDAQQINTSIANKSSAQIDFSEKNVDWAMRVSPHYYNTKEELDRFIEVVREVVR